MNVLVADDAPFIQEILKVLILEEGAHIVGFANSGREALELALKFKPDLIFMDLVMPDMSGIEATKKIVEALPNTRIVAMSTADQDFMVMKAIEAGCSHFIAKPFNKSELKQIIKLGEAS